MRSDQYIGLTKRAKLFLSQQKESGIVEREEFFKLTDAAFDSNPIMGKRVWVKPKGIKVQEEYFEEFLQAAPWSSGPMYFTCLRHVVVLKTGETEERDMLYQWYVDPLIRNGYDQESGGMNV